MPRQDPNLRHPLQGLGRAAPGGEGHCRRLLRSAGYDLRRPVSDIIGFAEHHAEALYRLGQEKFGTLPVVDLTARGGRPFPQPPDGFLYARCAVVAGRAVWESVFSDVDEFVPYTSTERDGEWLLYVPDEAYEPATGKEWDRTTRHCVESCSDRDGRPDMPD
ncbi:DUF4240 domain-containing protein [Streptomyces sp. NPDC002262]|uniref:DUF4240 domain-containing protein n=1 Tax=Streptomyces sp. NPDC002262 TaxID=3154414 RepID=UPI00331A0EC2